MFLDDYCERSHDSVRITAEQGSRFAKEIAGDFNPIHDPASRRFCVPGDLLCALVLGYYGISQTMTFRFRGMVGGDAVLQFPEQGDGAIAIADRNGKVYLEVERHGPKMVAADAVEPFIRRYAAFSGQSFPHILQPLLKQHGVMFNPARPLIMYDSMGFVLDDFAAGEPTAELAESTLEVTRKRADALLHFDIRVDGQHVGRGSKKLIVSGLRAYDEDIMQRVMGEYAERRAALRSD